MVAKILDPSLLTYEPRRERNYEKLKKALGEYGAPGEWGFKYVFKGYGYRQSTMQYGVELAVPQGCQDLDGVKAEVLEIVQHLRAAEGIKIIQINEHTHGDFGVWQLEYCPEYDRWDMTRQYYMRVVERYSGTLDEMMDRIARNHYVEVA